MYDEISVSFENTATDPLCYDHVAGKLYCGRDLVELQFKVKDRAFRKNGTTTVRFLYAEVERVQLVVRWFRPRVLIFQTRSPEKLDGFPGSKVGRVELQVLPVSFSEARKVADLIHFKQSEAFVAESEERLNRLRDES